jgi:hypothetical protein
LKLPRALAGAWIALAAAAVFASCGPQTREVRLTFYDSGTGPHGFTCRTNETPPKLLVSRAVDARRVSLVVDFFQLDGSPTCSAVGLLEWCLEQGCPLLPKHRSCVDVPLDFLQDLGDPDLTAIEAANAFLEHIEGTLVTNDPPEAIVLVRVVATTTECSGIAANPETPEQAKFDCASLVGCANSCPVYLPEASGDVQLDLDVRPELCGETAIQICASPDIAIGSEHCR